MRRPYLILATASLVYGTARADEGLSVLPAEFTLSTPADAQRLLVQRTSGGELTRQVTQGVTWSSADPSVADVAGGLVRPVADGETVVTVRVGEQSATAKVVVRGLNRPFAWGFRRHVEPVLAKLGCNSGACHGALAGKGGFRLSLRGYDPPSDHFNIVKQDGGRRVELADPGRSLFLAKPTGAIPHKGGVRFGTDSTAYRILSEWVAAGAEPPSDSDPVADRLEALPARSTHRTGDAQQIVVRARFADGSEADVTPWVKWSSSDESVCRVDDDGVATVVGPGEGAVVAWYASRIAIARLTIPYEGTSPAVSADPRKPRNFIDDQIDKQLARLNLPASPPCGDAEFVRRVFVDTVGRTPTADEVRAFLADPSPAKRDALADALLARPEFADYWTYKWSDILMISSTHLRPDALRSYYKWLHDRVASGTPWDQLVREILVSTGESLENGATNFYALNQSPEDMTENACQAFMGLSIGCARCHNHPLEKWTNDQYYAMANLFARVKAKGWGGEPGQGDGRRTLYVAESGDLVQPRTGTPQPPAPLDGRPLPPDDPADRRVSLARWMTAPDNPYFARAVTNRVWANFFGVGLVEKVDDVRVSNPASNEALLDAAASELVRRGFDLKALMKAILQSNAYQRSSRPLPGNRAERRFYSRYYPRRMAAEVLHDAVVQVTKVPTRFEFVTVPGGSRQKTDFYPPGTRAVQLYDSAVESYFLQAFGRNPRRVVCECERSDEPTVVQALHLSNGDTLNRKLKEPGNRVGELIRLRREGMSDAALVDDVYLTCLARYPTAAERDRLLALLPPAGAGDEREVVEDVLWGLMSSREFLFNH
jgi:hypothetical protein